MKFLEKHIFLIMISIVLVSSLLVYFVIEEKHAPKLLKSNDLVLDQDIVYDFDVSRDGDTWIIKGYAYHLNNVEAFENYISGPGTAYWIDSKVIVQSNQEVYALYTSPLYQKDVIVNGFDLGKAGFYSLVKMDKLAKDVVRLGVLINVDGEQRILWTTEVIVNE